MGIPTQFQRFWLWAKRQNHTYRPNRPLTPQEEALTVRCLHYIALDNDFLVSSSPRVFARAEWNVRILYVMVGLVRCGFLGWLRCLQKLVVL